MFLQNTNEWMIVFVYVDFSNPSNHIVMFILWFGLGTKTTWFLLGKYHELALNICLLSLQTRLMSKCLLKNTQFYLHKHS